MIEKIIRASVHRLLSGHTVEINRFCQDFDQNCPDDAPRSEISTNALKVLEGRLSHMHRIRSRTDSRDSKKKFFKPCSISKTYRDFLIYKYFVHGNGPIILTEGPTDVTYIRAALKACSAAWDPLSRVEPDGSIKVTAQFYNFPKMGAEILGLSGGSGNIKTFIELLHDFKSRLSKTVPHRPFIILLDSDKGAKNTLECVYSCFGRKIDLNNDDEFHVITRGTAIVKTPLLGKSESDIECLLDKKYVENPVGGLKFTREDKFDPALYFGKRTLSQLIYDNRKSVDFSGMDPLLNRLCVAAKSI